MATVTGRLNDFGLEALAAFSPEIVFTPSGPAVGGNVLYASRPIVCIPASNGDFTVELAATEGLHPAQHYTIAVQWLNSAGGYISKDFIDWELSVPEAGGVFADLVAAPANPAQVWVGLTAPANPTPGTWWLESNPADITDPLNTGNLYEWSK